ncbi:MAG: condensation domain-containing protein [Actinophytocola sp.]|uniref:condensation domain-containing protein n=1 Tax=Actinophytocola sp. TaxID=1872138 RepID=UPI003C71A47C
MTERTDLADLTEEQRQLLQLRLRRAARVDAPLSFTQEQLWFLDRLDPGNPAYGIPFGLRLTGPLDRAALARALAAVVDRHPALRTTFIERDGELRQRVHERMAVPLAVTDLTGAADVAEAARKVAAEHAGYGFDLTTGPLLALRLVVLADQEHLLLVTAHHIVFDATSAVVFSRDLVAGYDGRESGPAGSFARHAATERRRLVGPVLDEHLDYWRTTLADGPVTSTLPPDRARPPVQTHRGGRLPFVVPAELTAALVDRARRAGVTLNAVVLAGFAAMLHQVTGQSSVLLGMPVAGRPRTEQAAMIGSFANMLVLRIDLSGNDTASELFKRTQHTISEAYTHQDAPYARVVEAADPPRDPSHNPLFQVMLSLTDAPIERSVARGVEFTPVEVDSGLTDFDLFVTMSTVDGELRGAIGYNADLYLRETVERVADDFRAVLGILADQELTVPARGRVTLASSFTADPLRGPLAVLTGVLRLPVDVELAPYHQIVQHLLRGSHDTLADVVLLRWEDWLRHGDTTSDATSDTVLDEAWRDLAAAITANRHASTTPLLLVVSPPSPDMAYRVARVDDRLALLADATEGVHAVWFTDWADRYPVTTVFDPQADRLGHVPYTSELFAALAQLITRELHRITGRDTAEVDARLIATELATPAALAERATPARVGISPGTPPVAPRTPTEKRMAELWQQVLGLDEVGVTHDFFALGGHSLLATHLLSRVYADFDADVSLHTLFTHPTVEALARVVEESGERRGQAILPAVREGDLSLSSTQRRLWAIEQLGGDPTRHNTAFVAVLHGELAVGALRRAVADVVARHEILRTTFAERDGRPIMVVHESMDCWVGEIDLTDESPRDRTVAVRQHIRGHAKHRFDLAHGPLLRVLLLRTGDAEHHLLLGMHHIVCDNTSWGVLLGELAAGYAGAGASGLPALPVQFADFAVWQHDLLTDDGLRPQVAYWRERLRGAPPMTELATDKPRPRTRTDRAGRGRARIADGKAVRELARNAGITPFTALLAAYAVLLHERGAQQDVVLGVPQAGRNRPELEALIGCFTDLLPVRVDLTGQPTFRQVAQRVHRTVIESYQHQDVPFATIVDAVRQPRNPAHHPVFQCAFNLAGLPDDALSWSGLRLRVLDVPVTGIDFDLFLNLSWDGDGLEAVLEYSTDLFGQDGAEELLEDYVTRLGDLVARPDEPIATRETEPVHRIPVRVASSFPADDARAVLEWWAGRLGIGVAAEFAPPGQVLRSLLDQNAGLVADGLAALVIRWDDLLPAEPTPGSVAGFEARLAELCQALARVPGELAVLVAPSGRVTTAPWPGVFGHATDRLGAFLARHDGLSLHETADVGTTLARLLHRHVARPVDTVVLNAARFPGDLARFARTQTRFGRRVLVTGEVAPEVLALSGATASSVDTGGFVVDTGDPDALGHLWALDEPGPGGDYVLPAGLAAQIAGPLRTPEGVRAAMTGGPEGGRKQTRVPVPPRTERERALAAVWQEVLKVAEIGVHDDFFELGGDSMTAIEAVAAANRAGWTITPRQLVATPTIAELSVAEPEIVSAKQGLVTGEFPPTGAQQWFFQTLATTMSAPSHFNHPYYLSLRREVPAEHVARAVAALAAHHDVLRLRFRHTGTGWVATHAPVDGAVPFESHRLSDANQADAIVDRLQASLDLAHGPLARVVHFGLDGEPDRLLVICHHLVTDGVSRNLLLEDLQTALRLVASGEEPRFPAKTTAYRDWAHKLEEYRHGEALAAELPFWLAQAPGTEQLPVDLPGPSTFGTLDSVGTALDAEITGGLREFAREHQVGMGDLLAWAAVRLAADWTGCREWTIATTGHGREALFDDVDLSRTLGWFQVLYPVRLRLPERTDDAAAVAGIAGQLREVPSGGIGHGLTRFDHPDPEVRRRLSMTPQLTVNYMGAFGFEDVSSADELFDLCRGPLGRVQDPGGVWPSVLDVVGTLVGDRLRVDLNFGTRVHQQATAERLLGRLDGLLVALATRKG